jgi:carboxyl-terminal processing protease
LFDKNIPILTSIDQKGTKSTYDSQWRKPVAYLVDRSSRSGKEILAYAAKKYKTAQVLGDTTAGMVLAGSLFPLSNGDRLYLAVMDTYVDGERIEGHGVAPDVYIPWDIRYCQGKDPRIEKTFDIVVDSLDRNVHR